MKTMPTYALEEIFELIVTNFKKGATQTFLGSTLISCGDAEEVTVSFRKNSDSATLCIYDHKLVAVCNSSVKPVFMPTQKVGMSISAEHLLDSNPSHLANKIIAFILQNIPDK